MKHIMNEKLIKYLNSRGMKHTPERFEILDVLIALSCISVKNSGCGHFSIDDLFLHSRKAGLHFSLATIYRTLPIFIRAGILNKPIKSGDIVFYELSEHGHHDHLLCTECGAVIEFYHQKLEEIQHAVCEEYDFLESEHTLCIKGLCKKCRQ
jgi:Fur family transcriptional regulator, ferric uptake regulator